MHEQPILFDDDERTPSQPSDQLVSIGRLENRRQRVLSMHPGVAGRDGEQVEVVITKHGDGGVAQCFHFAQRGE